MEKMEVRLNTKKTKPITTDTAISCRAENEDIEWLTASPFIGLTIDSKGTSSQEKHCRLS